MENVAEPAVSFVVSTLNRCSSLKRCVDALLSMTTTRCWELVIVYQDETDGTREYLCALSQRFLPQVCVKAAFEPKRGLATARNTGWRLATGSIIAFTDDDCYVAKDFLDSLIQVFDDPGVGFMGGRLLLYDDSDYRITIQESLERRDFKPRRFIGTGSVHGANMAFRRSALERIAGFDESLGAGTPFPSEDIDAAAAALCSGIRGVYDPRPTVYHHHGRKTEDDANALRATYDAGRGAYYAKYILQGPVRAQYAKAWFKSIVRDCLAALPSGQIPQQSFRELKAGLSFVLGKPARQRARVACAR